MQAELEELLAACIEGIGRCKDIGSRMCRRHLGLGFDIESSKGMNSRSPRVALIAIRVNLLFYPMEPGLSSSEETSEESPNAQP